MVSFRDWSMFSQLSSGKDRHINLGSYNKGERKVLRWGGLNLSKWHTINTTVESEVKGITYVDSRSWLKEKGPFLFFCVLVNIPGDSTVK